jgi:hypothetical protein
MASHQAQVRVVKVGVGAAFDFIAGMKQARSMRKEGP